MVILDLDNCISDDGWRAKYIHWKEADPTKRYAAYHQLAAFDEAGNRHLFEESVNAFIIFTARPRTLEQMTMEWLKRNGVDWKMLLMREENEHLPSELLKERMLLSLPALGVQLTEIVAAYDDRQEVVEMYKRHGIRAYRWFIHDFQTWKGLDIASSETEIQTL